MAPGVEMAYKKADVNDDVKIDIVHEVNDAGDDKVQSTTATWAQVFSTADTYDIVLMTLGVIGAILTGISIPFFNVLFGRMLDALNTEPDSFQERIKGIALAFVGVAAINLLSGWLQVYCWSVAGERQTQKLREKYVRAILSQEIGWFDTIGASELATKVADAAGKVQDGLGRKVGDLLQYIAQFIAAFLVGFYLCWKLTLVLLCAIPLIGSAGAFMIVAITAATTESLSQYAAAGGLATEALGAIRTVTALNMQFEILRKYKAFLIEAMNVGIFKGAKVGLGNGAVFGACFLTYALGFWYGGKLVADDMRSGCIPGNGCITGGTILAVFFSVIMGSIALGQLAPPLASFIAAKAAIAPMIEIIERKPLIDGFSEAGAKPNEKPKGNIELKNIVFAYPSRPNINVCKGYNLSIKSGETVALCGVSGCGKSTVINLLLRFYDPQSGELTLDGNNIKDLNIKWLRSQIGYVGQEPVLFSGSIADNIAYGLDVDKDRLTPEEKEKLREKIMIAAKKANAHDFIRNFPQGYDTDVGSNGVAMSGGQKQRIAIARALVKEPAVLLLDEATSALDATSEKLVQQSIDALQQSHSQTTIVIAHRLSTIRNANKIALVNNGVIAELGTHDQLVGKDGLYADLIRLQMTSSDTEENKNSDENEESVTHKIEEGDVTSSTVDKKTALTEVATAELSKEESKELNRKMWGLITEQWFWSSVGIFGSAAFGAIFPVWGLLLAKTQRMFYYTDPDVVQSKAADLAIYYIIMAIIAVISSTLQFGGIAKAGEQISMKLRDQLFKSLIRREIAFFDDEKNAIGTLTTRLSDDSRIVHKATGEAIAKQLQAIFTLAIGLGIGLNASWKICLVVLATFPINIAASAIQMQAIAGQQYDNSGSGDNSSGALISSAFTHMRTVSAFSVQHFVADEYANLTDNVSKIRQGKSFMAGIGFGGSNCSLFLTYALLFWYGSTLLQSEHLGFEEMMTAILCLMLGALGLGQAMTDIGDQKSGLQAAKRIFTSIDEGEKASIDGLSTQGTIPTSRAVGKIELKNVNFRYPSRPDAEVCKNYNLTIESGQVVALVGPSGSGKSTIMSLLLRFYDPVDGSVLLDGVDIKTLNVRWLRSQIGYVGQEPVLFQGSVADNISKGRASDEIIFGSVEGDIELGNISDSKNSDIIESSKAANAHDFILGFPNKYDTDVGEGSIMISGGQKQRIAIARALIKKPAVLLLDEATSALDAASEKLVQQSIDELQQSKSQTTIVIAHRLTTIKNADKIAVIDKGEVVEIGTHNELLAKEGLYHQLWNKQAGNKSSDNLAALVSK